MWFQAITQRSKGFTASVDIRLRRGDWICEGTGENKEIVGQVVKFKIEKNKTYKRMQTGEFDFYFAENASNIPVSSNDNEKSIVMCAVEQGIIERAGAWFMCYGNKYQGIVSLINALKSNKELVLKLKADIMKMLVTNND